MRDKHYHGGSRVMKGRVVRQRRDFARELTCTELSCDASEGCRVSNTAFAGTVQEPMPVILTAHEGHQVQINLSST